MKTASCWPLTSPPAWSVTPPKRTNTRASSAVSDFTWAILHTDLCESDAAVESHAQFPLTPTLSLRERENDIASLDKPERYGLAKRLSKDALSPRERVGVRGNRACHQNPLVRTEICGR